MENDAVVLKDIEDVRIHLKWIDNHLPALQSAMVISEREFETHDYMSAAAHRNLQTCIRSYLARDGLLGLIDVDAQRDFHCEQVNPSFRGLWLRVLDGDCDISAAEIYKHLPAIIEILTQFSRTFHSVLERSW